MTGAFYQFPQPHLEPGLFKFDPWRAKEIEALLSGSGMTFAR
jgi:hypothetical protein